MVGEVLGFSHFATTCTVVVFSLLVGARRRSAVRDGAERSGAERSDGARPKGFVNNKSSKKHGFQKNSFND
jgi:hypothetical protein